MTSQIRIFVVDDEEDLTDLLHYQLGKEGYKVKFTNNPFEALAAATRLARQYGIALKKGMIVFAGAATAAHFIEGHAQVVVKVDGLGEAAFAVV